MSKVPLYHRVMDYPRMGYSQNPLLGRCVGSDVPFASRLPFSCAALKERCSQRQKSRVERLKAKMEPLFT